MSSGMHLLSRGRVHKGLVYPGETVEFEVSLLCSDDAGLVQKRAESPQQPFDADRVERLFRRYPSTPSDARSIELRASCAQATGLCLADSTWVNDLSSYAEGLSHPYDAAADAASRAGDDAGSWGLWSWLGGKPDEAQPAVRWEEGQLPKQVLGKHQANVQKVLETETAELLPARSRLRLGELRTLSCRLTLPQELPPSYQGYALKYVYYVWCCVVWKEDGAGVVQHVLKLPFSVWNPAASLRPIRPVPLPAGFDYEWSVEAVDASHQCERSRAVAETCFERLTGSSCDDAFAILASCAPETAQTPVEQSLHSHANAAIESLLALPSQHETPVKHKGTSFLRLRTLGMHCSTGGSVSGILQAVDNDVCSCVRVTIRLEYEERVPAALFKSGTFVPASSRQFPRSTDNNRPEFSELRLTQKKTVAEIDEIMLDCDESGFSFVLPPSSPPTIYTDKRRVACENVILWQLPLQVHVSPWQLKPQCKPQTYTYAT